MEILETVLLFSAILSRQKFMHATAQLLWHVQTYFIISLLEFEGEQNKISIKFEIWWHGKNVGIMCPLSIVSDLPALQYYCVMWENALIVFMIDGHIMSLYSTQKFGHCLNPSCVGYFYEQDSNLIINLSIDIMENSPSHVGWWIDCYWHF